MPVNKTKIIDNRLVMQADAPNFRLKRGQPIPRDVRLPLPGEVLRAHGTNFSIVSANATEIVLSVESGPYPTVGVQIHLHDLVGTVSRVFAGVVRVQKLRLQRGL